MDFIKIGANWEKIFATRITEIKINIRKYKEIIKSVRKIPIKNQKKNMKRQI